MNMPKCTQAIRTNLPAKAQLVNKFSQFIRQIIAEWLQHIILLTDSFWKKVQSFEWENIKLFGWRLVSPNKKILKTEQCGSRISTLCKIIRLDSKIRMWNVNQFPDFTATQQNLFDKEASINDPFNDKYKEILLWAQDLLWISKLNSLTPKILKWYFLVETISIAAALKSVGNHSIWVFITLIGHFQQSLFWNS